MGLFRKFGRRFGRLSEEAREAKEAHATYRCAECEAGFYEHEGKCPECGAAVIVERDSTDDPVTDDESANTDATDSESTPDPTEPAQRE
ncbi:zinc ribbon domain-containing protein [Haloarchaeobius sp. DT45]|uniref:zinc ribbon domain-containing protein n=1 Tax=Haloarchaeobius sp. DT45 TaxID=3446116 RepID=UPI003F6A9969